MEWVDGQSSNIARFAYDASREVLIVEFINGGTYEYFDVGESVFEQMKSAPSRGSFLANSIKGNYRYARV